MPDRKIDGFFYGLFMDPDVLAGFDIPPRNPRRAFINDYKLHIGDRATLWPTTAARAYGMVYSLTHAELNTLYGGAGLKDYNPEAVAAIDLAGSNSIPCLCYNLPTAPSSHEANHEYAGKLQIALTKLDFPQEYVNSLLSPPS